MLFQDIVDENPDIFGDETKDQRSVSVDLSDNKLAIDISDAVSEKDRVKFTVHTKVSFLALVCFLV